MAAGHVRAHAELLDQTHPERTYLAIPTCSGGRARIVKPLGAQTLRHSYTDHLLEMEYDIWTAQELLSHRDVATTKIYTHVLDRDASGVLSPLDRRVAGAVDPAGALDAM